VFFRREQGIRNEKAAGSHRMVGDDLAERLLVFAERVLRICRDLRQDAPGRHVARRRIRAALEKGHV